jgi:citronellyl-CoA synthetase
MATQATPGKGHVLGFSDLLPGLLSVSVRLPSIIRNMRELLGFEADARLSLGSVLERNAGMYSNKTALLYEDERYSHAEFNARINQYAHYYISKGIGKGDVMIVLVDNRPELLMLIGALSKLGAVASLINPNQRGEVLEHSINLTRGRHFIVGEELLGAFEEVRPGLNLGTEDHLYYEPESNSSVPPGYISLPEMIEDQPTDNPSTTQEVTLQDPFAYVFTSGTTGMPKASVQTHRRWFTAQYWFGRIVMNLKPDDVHYCALPFCHTNGLHVAWGSASGCGSALAIRRKFSASNFLPDVRKFKANSFIYIGEICRYLMNQPERPNDADNPLVKCVGNGLRPEIWREFKKRYGIRKVFELFGAAEGTLIFTNLLNIDCSVGLCLTPFAIVRYDVENDEPVKDENGFMIKASPGEQGMIIAEITDALPFAGYTEKKETEKKILRNVFVKDDVWFNFGDLVFNQGYRHIQFVDRLGDTFRWKGENVSTTEVEKEINGFEQVLESTVYGVQIPGTDGRAGMMAAIPSVDADKFDFKGLAALLTENLPSYAVPKFVRLKQEFETTGTHKIKKVRLREEGFDRSRISDPLYVLLPGSDEYAPLTAEIHDGILNGAYKF